MPGFVLLTTSSPLLGAALAAAAPAPLVAAEAERSPRIVPIVWSLATAQETQPAEGDPPAPDGEAPPAEGEIVVEGQVGPPKSDPVEAVNEESYRAVQAVDAAVIEPVANAYRDGLPEPIRDGLGNVVRNLGEPSVALNFLLQGKVGKAFETLGRMAINTTIGVGGLFDVAEKRVGLPYRRNGFADTMGYYGVGPGPYLYLPVSGATTVRDLAGRTLDQLLLPFAVGEPFNKPAYAATYFVVNGLDQRLEFDEELGAIAASEDPYRLRRETYLAQRRAEIAALKGEPVSERDRMLLEELEERKAETRAASGTAPAPELAEDAATPVEPPANPEALLITHPR